jgi:hypothetical protein
MATALHVVGIVVDGQALAGHVHGGLLVPAHESNWLVHLATTRTVELQVGTEYALTVTTRERRTVEGRAVLRRSDGQAHYFVGDSVPDGLAETN